MTSPTYRIRIQVPQSVRGMDRETFYGWLWNEFSDDGLLGVHEGTLLTEQAVSEGYETESWLPTIDAGLAPRDRDWIGNQKTENAELYFGSHAQGEKALKVLAQIEGLSCSSLEEVIPEDWNAKWRASFQGADVAPFWRVLPPWVDKKDEGRVVLRINPGAGFGTGTHETTQLCLEVLGEAAGGPQSLKGMRVLDFGSGSGILSIGAALLGARVDAVEIDPLANDNAAENSVLSGVEKQIRFFESLDSTQGTYQIVMANILRPILLEFSDRLLKKLARPGGKIVLSGLVEPDLVEVIQCFGSSMGGRPPLVRSKGEWRALVFN